MDIDTKIIPDFDPHAIQTALSVLQRGGLIAFPTDTVYGLAALVTDTQAIERIFQAKERSPNKAIAVLVGSMAQLKLVTTGLGPYAVRLAQKFWPGALTLVVVRHASLPEILSPNNTVGVRMPNHPFALELLQAAPLAVTSANLSGGASPRNAREVLDQLRGRVELVVDGGDAPVGIPSTVVDCTGTHPVILRSGAISSEEILSLG